MKSKLCGFLFLCLLCILLGTNTNLSFVSFLPLPLIVLYWRILLFEALLIENSIEYALGTFTWFSLVDKNGLYLGAIPIFPSHEIVLTKKLAISAVLAIIEPFEMSSSTLIGTPISSSAWEAAGVQHLLLNSPDFVPPSFAVLDEGADFINHNLTERRNVYVHCKSGKGRSASVVCAYFLKYKKMDPHSAWREVCKVRPVIFSTHSPQFRNILDYESWIREKREIK